MNNWHGRAILFLIVAVGCVWSLHYSTGHFKSDRQTILLNTTRPDFDNLLNTERQQSFVLSKNGLKEYFDYFHLIQEAMPDNAQGLLILGYLEEITGDRQGARIFLEEAYHLDPSFFFTGFNLALVLFEQGEYAQSSDLLQKALAIPPQITLGQMMGSVIYRQIFSSIKDSRDIIAGLQQAYHDADVLLTESSAKQKNLQGEDLAAPQVHAHFM